jgi:hypothetical protein
VIRIILSIALCAAAVDASAQTPAPREPREPRQTLTAAVNVSGAASDDSADTFGDGRTAVGQHTDADALITYQRRAGRLALSVTGRSVGRYAPGEGGATATRHQAGFDLAMTGTHTQFRIAESGSYSPFYQFGAGVGVPVSPLAETMQSHGDFANARLVALGSSTVAELKQMIGRHTALAMAYDFHKTTFGQKDLDFESQNAGGSLSQRLSRYLTLHTGYTYRLAHTSRVVAGDVVDHAVDLGLDYSRTLSPTRKTAFNFSSGSSLTPGPAGMAFHLTGNATLARAIGRSWSAKFGVNRSVQLLEGFVAPVLTDAATAAIGGPLTGRTSISTSFGYARGQSAVAQQNGATFGNWTGGLGFHAALSRSTSIDAQYFYYGHRFDPRLLGGADIARELTRHGVRVGLTWHGILLRSRG